MKKFFTSVAVCAAAAIALTGCGDDKAKEPAKMASADTTITVGATPVPHADILNFIAPEMKKQGVTLKVLEFSDYVKPNMALADKEIDANFFQHKPYLDSFAKERGLKLSSLVAVHIEPMGVYSKKFKDVKSVPDGAKIAIPNDPTNGGRALRVLADAGIFGLKDGVGVNGTPADIVNNAKNVKILEMEAAVLPRTLDDVDFAVINSNFALSVGLNPTKDSLFTEAKDSPYANIVAVRSDDNREVLQKLKSAITSPAVRDFILEKYKGSVVPAF